MATIVMMIGRAIISVLSFSGSNYMFSKLGKEDIDIKRKRHDKAIEDLQKAQAAWNKNRTEWLDFFFFNTEIQQQVHALHSNVSQH